MTARRDEPTAYGSGGENRIRHLLRDPDDPGSRTVCWIVAPVPRRPRDHQLQDAAKFQQRLTPQQRRFPGLEVAASCEPLADVGGDYADAVTMADGRVLLVVADVCGNGVPAALVAMSLHGILQCYVKDHYSLGEIIERLNSYLQFSVSDPRFVTMACVAVDLQSGVCEAINAGHPPLLVIQPHGPVRRLKSGATFPLGITAIDPRTETDALAPEDVVLVYSDGWTELCDPSGAMLGVTGLSQSVSSACCDYNAAPLPAVLDAVHARLASFQGLAPPHDDRTLMLARRRSPGE